MTFNYCPDCGTKASVERQSATDYECAKCGWHYWNNPCGTASTILINSEGMILLSRRGIQPKKDMYDIPGGFLEYNENAYDGAAREMLEEGGVKIKNPQLLGVWQNEYLPDQVSTCDTMFVATEWEGELVAQDDVAAFEWQPVEFIESDEFAWSYPGMIEKLQAFIATIKR